MIIDPSGRGPTMRQMYVAGIALILVAALVTTFLLLRYAGTFTAKVPVTAELTTTGDGLPANADVKFRGVTVGQVESVEVAAKGELQKVKINMKPKHIDGVPSTVTARVVPANVFAVTSVELLDNGPSEPLHEGSVIQQDKSKETIALQDTLTTLRNVLNKLEPEKIGRILGSLSEALDSSARVPGSTIERLDRWLTAVNNVDIASDLQNFTAAAAGLNQSAPELITVLGNAVTTAKTIADRRENLTSLLLTAGGTVDTVNGIFARNPDAGKNIVSGLNTTFGAIADDPDAIRRTLVSVNEMLPKLSSTFTYGPSKQQRWNVGITFTPFKAYTRADCPRYDDMAGPSCFTAPVGENPGTLPVEMWPQRLQQGLPVGLPIPPNPFQGTPLEGIIPSPPAAPAPTAPASVLQKPGLKGPAGVAAILGRKPTPMELLLLGSVVAGGEVVQFPAAGDGR